MFPAGFDQGYCLHGFGRESLKLSGLKLRDIVLANGASTWLRPSFIFSYMTGTAEELAYPLLLVYDVPFRPTLGFGHNDMFWYRLIERLGRNSLVGTTVHDLAELPSHLGRTSITPTGPARRATSRQPSARAAFWASG